ncbi:MAG: tRNA (adenosine(37)-N6)-dimethylallyltransferase MiaA [Clostridiales bacterium]|nr:tRNA (adenosine(37)-N6)-dimethylallyltransferase MiaA [Clostridiales bacterium]
MNKVLFIGGPTGIGKSALGISLAKRYNGVIVSADSMQIYQGMDIGTGKVTESEKAGVTHTMIDIVAPNEDYSVQKYCIEATRHIQEAWKNKQLPIVTGGTGLYINALLHPQNFAQAAPNTAVRQKYETLYREGGAERLHAELEKIDPISAKKISVQDVKRTIRALEIFETTGQRKSENAKQTDAEFAYLFLIPETERTALYTAINRRVDQMMASGFVEEVKNLQPYWSARSMEAIGYREIIQALQNGEDPRAPNTIETIKQNTRRYAKRQITFFKWIQAEKHYIQQPYFDNAVSIADSWYRE